MQSRFSRPLFAVALVATLFTSTVITSSAMAETDSAESTTITVTDMHCKHCAKKIAAKLYLVPGVLEVQASVKANKARIIPQANKSPSPKALWEAIEAAGFEPVKLEGPAGEYSSKPEA